jgi:hypothetical protein
MNDAAVAGAWGLLLLAGALVAALLFALAAARGAHAWRGVGALTVYLLAVVAERYGLPLALALWSGRAAQRQFGGHAWPREPAETLAMVLGWQPLAPWGPLQLAGAAAVATGIGVLLAARSAIAAAAREGRLADRDVYARVRHPEYAACGLAAAGALLLWPGWLGLALLAPLAWFYTRAAHLEDAELRAAHGDAWRRYAAATPAFVPRLRGD